MGGKALLVVVVGFIIVSAYTMGTMRTSTERAGAGATQSVAKENSKRLALSGAKMTLAKINQDTSWRSSLSRSMAQSDGGSFTATMSRIPLSDISILRSISNYPVAGGSAIHDTVDLLLQKNTRNSFSILAWMTNSEGSNIYWVTGDTVWGKMHTNGKLKVNGTPCFTGYVSTASGFDKAPGRSPNYGKYLGGYNGSADSITLPTSLSELTTAASAGGKTYVGNIYVTLNPGTSADGNGTAEIRLTATGSIIATVAINSSFNGVIQSTGNLHVKGTLDGRLTLSSLTDIYVDDNVYLENDPRTTSSNDILGLVAESDVIVTNNTANNSNVTIQASIFARTGSFKAENHDTRPKCGELRVLGSIVQNVRGGVGTFSTGYWGSTTTLKTGFSKRYEYDERLADNSYRPPYYPGFLSSRLTIVDTRFGGVQADGNLKKVKIKL
jgi:cytoskeletal protein CcmA (bactofilin family)